MENIFLVSRMILSVLSIIAVFVMIILFERNREKTLDEFSKILISRLPDATTDVEGVTNLINETVKEFK